MGYSCTKKAADTLERIGKSFATEGNPNILTIGGTKFFFEHGREQTDGAITGKLMEFLPNELCQSVGTVRIAPNGTVSRFPRLRADVRKKFSITAIGYDYDFHGDVVYVNVSPEQAKEL